MTRDCNGASCKVGKKAYNNAPKENNKGWLRRKGEKSNIFSGPNFGLPGPLGILRRLLAVVFYNWKEKIYF